MNTISDDTSRAALIERLELFADHGAPTMADAQEIIADALSEIRRAVRAATMPLTERERDLVESLREDKRVLIPDNLVMDLIDIIDRLASPTCSPGNHPVWQPIETAPQDTTSVLLVDEHGCVCEGYLSMECHRGWYQANTHWTDAHDGQIFPTHWMPLPAAPVQSSGER